MTNSEVVEVAATDARDVLHFLYYLKSFAPQKHSNCMQSKGLKILCFTKIFECMHVFILHVLSARLTKESGK